MARCTGTACVSCPCSERAPCPLTDALARWLTPSPVELGARAAWQVGDGATDTKEEVIKLLRRLAGDIELPESQQALLDMPLTPPDDTGIHRKSRRSDPRRLHQLPSVADCSGSRRVLLACCRGCGPYTTESNVPQCCGIRNFTSMEERLARSVGFFYIKESRMYLCLIVQQIQHIMYRRALGRYPSVLNCGAVTLSRVVDVDFTDPWATVAKRSDGACKQHHNLLVRIRHHTR